MVEAKATTIVVKGGKKLTGVNYLSASAPLPQINSLRH